MPYSLFIKYKNGESKECAAAIDPNKNKGINVGVEKCARNSSHMWGLYSDGTIRNASNGQCLELADGVKQEVKVQLSPCSDKYTRMWHFEKRESGVAIVGSRGNCLERVSAKRLKARICHKKQFWTVAPAS